MDLQELPPKRPDALHKLSESWQLSLHLVGESSRLRVIMFGEGSKPLEYQDGNATAWLILRYSFFGIHQSASSTYKLQADTGRDSR